MKLNSFIATNAETEHPIALARIGLDSDAVPECTQKSVVSMSIMQIPNSARLSQDARESQISRGFWTAPANIAIFLALHLIALWLGIWMCIVSLAAALHRGSFGAPTFKFLYAKAVILIAARDSLPICKILWANLGAFNTGREMRYGLPAARINCHIFLDI
jgi:hypothetical protein